MTLYWVVVVKPIGDIGHAATTTLPDWSVLIDVIDNGDGTVTLYYYKLK